MASSVVEICNRALDAIGAKTIISLDDETREAGLCRRYYPQLRDEVIRSHPWNFALVRVALPALSVAPAWGYASAYQLPVDCLRVLSVGDADPFATPWRIEGRTIVTDEGAPLSVLYLRTVPDSGNFDPMFVSALAARLAMELAMPLASDAGLRAAMEKEFLSRMRAARSADGQEGTPSRIYAEEFVQARH